jgi:hypothetical protein
MINLLCKLCSCGKARPTYNFEGLSANFCLECKTSDMINVNDKKCHFFFISISVVENVDNDVVFHFFDIILEISFFYPIMETNFLEHITDYIDNKCIEHNINMMVIV